MIPPNQAQTLPFYPVTLPNLLTFQTLSKFCGRDEKTLGMVWYLWDPLGGTYYLNLTMLRTYSMFGSRSMWGTLGRFKFQLPRKNTGNYLETPVIKKTIVKQTFVQRNHRQPRCHGERTFPEVTISGLGLLGLRAKRGGGG